MNPLMRPVSPTLSATLRRTRVPLPALIASLLIAVITLPAFAAQPVTVAQLLRQVHAARHQSDEDAASALAGMELTERLSSAQLPHLLAMLPGAESREALTVLADSSVFLDPPSAEIPSTPAPDVSGQRAIMSRVVDYVTRTNQKLPDFFATRSTTRFEDSPGGIESQGTITARHIPEEMVAQTKALVTYRNGAEVDTGAAANRTRHSPITSDRGLRAWGLLGPVLAKILVDASQGTLTWSRWEQQGEQPLAVFRYKVPMEKSTYTVKFCCYPNGTMLVPVDRDSAYHGEIAVDPDSGSVLRLTLMADLDEGDLSTLLTEAAAGAPLSRADMMVEYGPVSIGGKSYICPIHSIAISRARGTSSPQRRTLRPRRWRESQQPHSARIKLLIKSRHLRVRPRKNLHQRHDIHGLSRLPLRVPHPHHRHSIDAPIQLNVTKRIAAIASGNTNPYQKLSIGVDSRPRRRCKPPICDITRPVTTGLITRLTPCTGEG